MCERGSQIELAFAVGVLAHRAASWRNDFAADAHELTWCYAALGGSGRPRAPGDTRDEGTSSGGARTFLNAARW